MVSAAPCHVMTLQLFVRSCCSCLPALCTASLLRVLRPLHLHRLPTLVAASVAPSTPYTLGHRRLQHCLRAPAIEEALTSTDCQGHRVP